MFLNTLIPMLKQQTFLTVYNLLDTVKGKIRVLHYVLTPIFVSGSEQL